VVLSDSPRAYWRLGETSGTVADDEVGSANGQYRNGVVLGALGALAADANKAVRFDGVDDRIGMSDPPSGVLDLGTGDLTIEAWVKATAGNERTIISKRVFLSNQSFWEVSVTDDSTHVGEVRVAVYTGGNGNNGNNGTSRQAYGPAVRVDNNAWHHVVVLLDRDSGITVYVDGVSRTTAGTFVGNMNNTGELILGKSTNFFTPHYKGELDEVALYGNLLAPARIQAHLAKGRGTG
jgi:Concanavalin A-like lectin/glucanases superfamily